MEVHFKDFLLDSSDMEISEKRKSLLNEIDRDVSKYWGGGGGGRGIQVSVKICHTIIFPLKILNIQAKFSTNSTGV